MIYVAILLAGGLGALLRHGINRSSELIPGEFVYPFATLTVNVIGSFLMGYLAWMMLYRWSLSPQWQTAILTGLLGGFTTFSAFSLETIEMLEAGNAIRAMSYVMASLVLSVLFCWLGLSLARSI